MIRIWCVLLVVLASCASAPKSGFVDFSNNKAQIELEKIGDERPCKDSLSTLKANYFCQLIITVETIYKSFSVSFEDDREMARLLKGIRKSDDTSFGQWHKLISAHCALLISKEMERDGKFIKEHPEMLSK